MAIEQRRRFVSNGVASGAVLCDDGQVDPVERAGIVEHTLLKRGGNARRYSRDRAVLLFDAGYMTVNSGGRW